MAQIAEKLTYNTGDGSLIVGSGKSLEKEAATHSVFLPENSMEERSLTVRNTFTFLVIKQHKNTGLTVSIEFHFLMKAPGSYGSFIK